MNILPVNILLFHICVISPYLGGCSHVIVGKYWETSIDVPNITACKRDSWESFQKRKAEGCQPENTITFGEYVPTMYDIH